MDYDGDLPAGDYTVDCTAQDDTLTKYYELGTAEVELSADPAHPENAVSTYTHTDHLGTLRLQTTEVPALAVRPVYTAFGERVDVEGNIGTRYGYVGQHGYENFDDLDWGTWQSESVPMPFVHVGARWYDPGTGRFLQRDKLGIASGSPAYQYTENNPVALADPNGKFPSVAPPSRPPFGGGFQFDQSWRLRPRPTPVPVVPPSKRPTQGNWQPGDGVPPPLSWFHCVESFVIYGGIGGTATLIAEVVHAPLALVSKKHSVGDIAKKWWEGWPTVLHLE